MPLSKLQKPLARPSQTRQTGTWQAPSRNHWQVSRIVDEVEQLNKADDGLSSLGPEHLAASPKRPNASAQESRTSTSASWSSDLLQAACVSSLQAARSEEALATERHREKLSAAAQSCNPPSSEGIAAGPMLRKHWIAQVRTDQHLQTHFWRLTSSTLMTMS